MRLNKRGCYHHCSSAQWKCSVSNDDQSLVTMLGKPIYTRIVKSSIYADIWIHIIFSLKKKTHLPNNLCIHSIQINEQKNVMDILFWSLQQNIIESEHWILNLSYQKSHDQKRSANLTLEKLIIIYNSWNYFIAVCLKNVNQKPIIHGKPLSIRADWFNKNVWHINLLIAMHNWILFKFNLIINLDSVLEREKRLLRTVLHVNLAENNTEWLSN